MILINYVFVHFTDFFLSYPETIIRLLLLEEGCRSLSLVELVKWTGKNEVLFRDFVCQFR